MFVRCKICKSKFETKPCRLRQGKGKYCTIECYRLGRTNGKYVPCNYCKKPLWRTPSNKAKHNYCNAKCRYLKIGLSPGKGESHHNWNGGHSTYRKRALDHYGAKCSNEKCPLTRLKLKIPRLMLDVDHRNSDRSNNKLRNLQVLCVWCHIHKTRFAAMAQ